MILVRLVIVILLSVFSSLQANESLFLRNDSGETFMIHQLQNGELWGSFMITDQVSDSFADHELIVLQIDHNKPIKLEQKKRCGTPAGEKQKVAYSFENKQQFETWKFSKTTPAKSNFLKITGWDKDIYQHMKSDRRPEVVDFPIQGSLALTSLWQQFQQGEQLVFLYTTDAGESKRAVFELAELQTNL